MTVSSNSNWDLSVYNRNGQLVLVVEVKCKSNVSTGWVTKFRRNLLAHGIFPKAPYFLIALLDKFYLWTNADANLDFFNEPTYIIDAHPILHPYFERAGVKVDKISENSLEIIITSWLGEIIHSEQLPENLDTSSQRWLIDSGLYAAVAGGKFEHEAVA